MSYPPTRPPPGLPLSPASNGGEEREKKMKSGTKQRQYFTGWVTRGFGIIECGPPVGSGYSTKTLKSTTIGKHHPLLGAGVEVNGTRLDFHSSIEAAWTRSKSRLQERAAHYRAKACECDRWARDMGFQD